MGNKYKYRLCTNLMMIMSRRDENIWKKQYYSFNVIYNVGCLQCTTNEQPCRKQKKKSKKKDVSKDENNESDKAVNDTSKQTVEENTIQEDQEFVKSDVETQEKRVIKILMKIKHKRKFKQNKHQYSLLKVISLLQH